MALIYPTATGLECGLDEAGRGCLAGPVFAAAVILPCHSVIADLGDSKQLSLCLRLRLRHEIETLALAWAVAQVDPATIDEVNILQASFLAMHQAIRRLEMKPTILLVDGNRFLSYPGIPHACLVKGDATHASIAAASILAKTYRDDYMHGLHQSYPMYGWDQNKGYPTPGHAAAIRDHGPSPHHRRSFSVKGQIRLPF